jgi:hypothetical protein
MKRKGQHTDGMLISRIFTRLKPDKEKGSYPKRVNFMLGGVLTSDAEAIKNPYRRTVCGKSPDLTVLMVPTTAKKLSCPLRSRLFY